MKSLKDSYLKEYLRDIGFGESCRVKVAVCLVRHPSLKLADDAAVCCAIS